MRKTVQLVLLSLVALLTYPSNFGVEGAVLRTNGEEQGELQVQADLNNVERELQRRRRGGGKGKGGKGKGGGSKGAGRGGGGGAGRGGRPIRFLPDRIDPIPFVNCIPLPPGFGDDGGGMMGKSKGENGGSGSGRGKGKGKGNRRRNRSMIRERVLSSHSSSSKGQIRNGRNRGGNRNGARRNGGGNGGNGGGKRMKMGMAARLPFCPPDAPTFFPTALPSFTPIPTFTPLPSITPFPSFTPFPTVDGDGPDGPDGPDTPAPATPEPEAPTVPGAPSVAPATAEPPVAVDPDAGAPVAVPPGTQRILVESTMDFGFFDTATPRAPTQEEIDGLMAATTQFYTDLLTPVYPNLESFEAVPVLDTFTAGQALPVRIDFDANAFFTDGKTSHDRTKSRNRDNTSYSPCLSLCETARYDRSNTTRGIRRFGNSGLHG